MNSQETLDPEVINLCNAMNELPGITTIESCCGHGEHEYRIWFIARQLSDLPRLLYYLDGCHSGFYGWRCEVTTDCAMSPVHFLITGPVGEQAYKESIEIAKMLGVER